MTDTALQGISEKNQLLYQRLKLSIDLGLRRQLFLAVCDDLALRNSLARHLEKDLTHRSSQLSSVQSSPAYPGFVSLNLNLNDPNPMSQITQWLTEHPRPVAMVAGKFVRPLPLPGFQILGVECLTRQSAAVQRLFLSYLQGAERGLSALETTLVLWMPRPWMHSIRQSAPEFWCWRTGVFEFEGDPTPTLTVVSASVAVKPQPSHQSGVALAKPQLEEKLTASTYLTHQSKSSRVLDTNSQPDPTECESDISYQDNSSSRTNLWNILTQDLEKFGDINTDRLDIEASKKFRRLSNRPIHSADLSHNASYQKLYLPHSQDANALPSNQDTKDAIDATESENCWRAFARDFEHSAAAECLKSDQPPLVDAENRWQAFADEVDWAIKTGNPSSESQLVDAENRWQAFADDIEKAIEVDKLKPTIEVNELGPDAFQACAFPASMQSDDARAALSTEVNSSPDDRQRLLSPPTRTADTFAGLSEDRFAPGSDGSACATDARKADVAQPSEVDITPVQSETHYILESVSPAAELPDSELDPHSNSSDVNAEVCQHPAVLNQFEVDTRNVSWGNIFGVELSKLNKDISDPQVRRILGNIQQLLDRQANPISLAMAYQQLGNLYRDRIEQGDRSQENLLIAIESYEQILLYLEPQTVANVEAKQLTTNFWPDLLNDLGNLYWILSHSPPVPEKGLNYLEKGIQTYHLALLKIDPETQPQSYALVQNNLGAAYGDLAHHSDPVATLQKSVLAYQEALRYRGSNLDPLKYAATQNNLGTTYWNLAQYVQPAANLKSAISAYTEAICYCGIKQDPLSYAMIQNNLGTAYWNLAQYEQPEEFLRLAIDAYQIALKYRTPNTAPAACAATHNNLGTAYWHLANRSQDDPQVRKNCLQRAIAVYETTLVLAQGENPNSETSVPLSFDLLATHNNLGLAYYQLASDAHFTWDEETLTSLLEKSLHYHLQALIGWQEQPDFHQAALSYIVQVIRAFYCEFGIQGQNQALSKVPSHLLPEIMHRL